MTLEEMEREMFAMRERQERLQRCHETTLEVLETFLADGVASLSRLRAQLAPVPERGRITRDLTPEELARRSDIAARKLRQKTKFVGR